MGITIFFSLLGLIVGGVITWLIASSRAKSAEAVNSILSKQIVSKDNELAEVRTKLSEEEQKKASLDAKYQEAEKNLKTMEEWVLDKLGAISFDALTRNSKEFLRLAEEKLKSQTNEGKQELGKKKELIDQSIGTIAKAITDMQQKLADVERGNVKISTLVEQHADVTSKLKDTTEHLKEALASSKKRGEWGQRMADDILRLVGFAEGINYIQQKTLEGSSGRPDYTFFLPNNLKVNMDVKFPLDNYQNYLNAQTDYDRKRFKEELLKNTKTMIKQVTNREYIDTANNTVDYVIVFIPNEQVYSFINETDTAIMDEALKHKVILCSPYTLYAVLAVIRQAVANFNLERTASEILKLLGEFSKQWFSYKEKFETMGKRLDDAKKEYDLLITTRSNMLERPLKKIDDLRKQESLALDEEIKLDELSLPNK